MSIATPPVANATPKVEIEFVVGMSMTLPDLMIQIYEKTQQPNLVNYRDNNPANITFHFTDENNSFWQIINEADDLTWFQQINQNRSVISLVSSRTEETESAYIRHLSEQCLTSNLETAQSFINLLEKSKKAFYKTKDDKGSSHSYGPDAPQTLRYPIQLDSQSESAWESALELALTFESVLTLESGLTLTEFVEMLYDYNRRPIGFQTFNGLSQTSITVYEDEEWAIEAFTNTLCCSSTQSGRVRAQEDQLFVEAQFRWDQRRSGVYEVFGINPYVNSLLEHYTGQSNIFSKLSLDHETWIDVLNKTRDNRKKRAPQESNGCSHSCGGAKMESMVPYKNQPDEIGIITRSLMISFPKLYDLSIVFMTYSKINAIALIWIPKVFDESETEADYYQCPDKIYYLAKTDFDKLMTADLSGVETRLSVDTKELFYETFHKSLRFDKSPLDMVIGELDQAQRGLTFYYCDGCGIDVFDHAIYHCQQCYRFDENEYPQDSFELCESCYQKGSELHGHITRHPGHTFEKFKLLDLCKTL
jgi:hypothetical protein